MSKEEQLQRESPQPPPDSRSKARDMKGSGDTYVQTKEELLQRKSQQLKS